MQALTALSSSSVTTSSSAPSPASASASASTTPLTSSPQDGDFLQRCLHTFLYQSLLKVCPANIDNVCAGGAARGGREGPLLAKLCKMPRCDYESKVAVQLFYRIKAKQQRCKKKKEGDHKNSHDDHACHAQSTHGENTHNSSSNPSVSGDTNDKNGNKSNDNCNEGYKDDNKTSMVDSVCAVDSKPGNENSDAYREFVLAERKKRRALAKQKRKDKKLKRRENNLKRERDIQEKEEKFRMQIQQRQQQSRDRQAQGLSQGDVQSEPQTLGRGSDGNATDKAVEKDENCANSRHAVNDCAESKKDHRNDGDRNSSENGNDIDNGKSNDIGNDHSNGHSNKCGESDLDEGYRRAGDVPRRANDSLKRKRAEEGEGQEEEDEGIVISFEEYGMTITKRYASPAELADAIIQNIPRTITLQSSTASTLLLSAAASASSSPPSSVSSSPSSSSPSSSSSSSSFRMEGLIGDIRVLQPTGVLLIVTRPYLEQQRIQGQLYCDLCGQFFDGKMGLREHTQTKHRTNYQTAIQTVERNLQQMVVYSKWMDPYLAYVAKQQPLREKDDKNTSASDGIHTTGDGRSSAGDDSQNGSVDADKQKTRQGLQLAREGRLAELRDFIQANQWDPAHPSSVDRHGSTSLLWAAGQGHLDVCRYLADECEVDPLDLHQTQKDGRNALHWAARNGKLGVCKWLVSDCKVPVDIQTFDGTSPFHWAVWQGHLPVCKWLVEEAGADKELRNSYGCNATHWASQQAVENIEMCRWLHADLRLDFGLINNNGHSALHKTALRGHALMTRWLVEEVRLDARHVQPDNDGDVPSKVARMEGFHELADWLVREEERLRDQPMQLD